MNVDKNRTLWYHLKKELNESESPIIRYKFDRKLVNKSYYRYVVYGRSLYSIDGYMYLLRKGGYIMSDRDYYWVLKPIPLDLTIKEARIASKGEFLTKNDMTLD